MEAYEPRPMAFGTGPRTKATETKRLYFFGHLNHPGYNLFFACINPYLSSSWQPVELREGVKSELVKIMTRSAGMIQQIGARPPKQPPRKMRMISENLRRTGEKYLCVRRDQFQKFVKTLTARRFDEFTPLRKGIG
jgi:hypothetical protein